MLPCVTSTLSTVTTGNPGMVTVTLYVPTVRSWNAKIPSLVVALVCSICVAVSVAFTCAFGTTAPAGSITVPLIAPRNVCEFSGVTANNTIRTKTLSRQFIFFLREFLSGWAAGGAVQIQLPQPDVCGHT